MFNMESRPNTICAGVLANVVCTVFLIPKAVAESIPLQGSFVSKTVSFTLNVRKTLPIVWCTRSIIALAYGLQAVIILGLILKFSVIIL